MIEPILHIRHSAGSAIHAPALAVVSIVAVFGFAVVTGTSLLAAFVFALLIALVAGEVAERAERYGSIDEARQRLDELEQEGRQ